MPDFRSTAFSTSIAKRSTRIDALGSAGRECLDSGAAGTRRHCKGSDGGAGKKTRRFVFDRVADAARHRAADTASRIARGQSASGRPRRSHPSAAAVRADRPARYGAGDKQPCERRRRVGARHQCVRPFAARKPRRCGGGAAFVSRDETGGSEYLARCRQDDRGRGSSSAGVPIGAAIAPTVRPALFVKFAIPLAELTRPRAEQSPIRPAVSSRHPDLSLPGKIQARIAVSPTTDYRAGARYRLRRQDPTTSRAGSMAISLRPLQNASSRLTLVLWPAMTMERLTTGDFIGRLPFRSGVGRGPWQLCRSGTDRGCVRLSNGHARACWPWPPCSA